MTDGTAVTTDTSSQPGAGSPGPDAASEAPQEVPYAFRYRLPDEFSPVSDPAVADNWVATLREQLPFADAAESRQAAQQLSRAHAWLVALGETPTDMAMCIGMESVKGESKFSMGMVMVSVRHTGHQDRLLAAEGIYRATEQKLFAGESWTKDLDFPLGKGVQGRQDSLLAAKLPCGPGVMSVSLRSVELNGSTELRTRDDSAARKDHTSPDLGNAKIPMAALQLIIPAPEAYCVYVTISTPSVYLLDSYCERLSHIGRTFSFD